MTGTCSECGLEFQWRDVLNPLFALPRWCVEYGQADSALGRVLRTLAMALRPSRFWRELQMWHEPRWLRLALLVPALLVVLYLVFAASTGIATWHAAKRSAAVSARTTPPWLDGAKATLMPWTTVTQTSAGPMPTTLLRTFHWYRIVDDGWQALRDSTDFFGNGDGRDTISGRAFDVLGTLLVCPIAFVLLPISRRVAKVRWRHVMRIAVYGLLLCMIPLATDLYDQMQNIRISWTNEVSILMSLMTFALAMRWWSAATRNYLHIPHGWAVGAYVVVFAYLFQWLVWQVIDLAIEILGQ